MHERILYKMRDKIRSRQYIMTVHAEDEMEDDDLSIFDVESCILTGEIVERQKDSQTGEWKYLVKGRALLGNLVITVGKISPTDTLVIITIYRE
jgi:hypothetical protein